MRKGQSREPSILERLALTSQGSFGPSTEARLRKRYNPEQHEKKLAARAARVARQLESGMIQPTTVKIQELKHQNVESVLKTKTGREYLVLKHSPTCRRCAAERGIG